MPQTSLFEYQTVIRLADTDAAGVLFFASQFRLVHEALEALLESRGLPVRSLLGERGFRLAIVHAATSYTMPLTVGDAVTIRLQAERGGNASLTIRHWIVKNPDRPAGNGETVHVSIDPAGKKIPLPVELNVLFTGNGG